MLSALVVVYHSVNCSSSSGGYQFINQGILYLQILRYIFYYSQY